MSPRRGGRLLILGGRLDLYMDDGTTFVCPPEYGLVHDPSGRNLDKCSLWLAPIEATGERIEKLSEDELEWFGNDYEARGATVDLPADGWELQGHVAELVYFRSGRWEDDWRHPFDPPQPLFESRRTGKPTYWLRLPADCVISWRGFVKP